MKVKLLSLIGWMALLGVSQASAAPITYDLVGVTAAFADNTETDIFSGSFTYDATSQVLSAVAITVSGDGPDTGSFDTPETRPPGFNYQIEFAETSGDMWILSFFDIFADVSNPLSAVYNSDPTVLTNGVTGDAVPATPLPAALPLFVTGLGGLGLFGWRRKRKYAATIAAG